MRPRGRRVVDRRPIEVDVDRELESHIALRAEELEHAGWGAAEARAEAERVFGDRLSVARHCAEITHSHRRRERRARSMEGVVQDVRYGLRALLASPGFALVSVLTLALGIGANTAIFSVVNGVLLRPLPFEDPGELLWIREAGQQGGTMAAAWPSVVDWRNEAESLAAITGYTTWTTTVLGGDEPVHTRLAGVSMDFWDVFRVRPLAGRLPSATDYAPGAAPVALVSEAFWRSQFGGRPLEGWTLEVSGVRAGVIGVLPAAFDYPTGTDIWNALTDPNPNRTAHNYSVVARMGGGVGVEQARQELNAIAASFAERAPGEDLAYLAAGAHVDTLHEALVGDSRRSLLLLLGASALVLLIACTNLASTLLARGTSRERELAVRSALGAPRARIVRQLFTEGLILAVLGAAAGVVTAWVLIRGVVAANAAAVPRLAGVGIDGTVLVFTAAVALATAGLFGLIPALRAGRADVGQALRSGSRGNASARGRTWSILVGTEVALALILLVGSGLLVRSFRSLLSEDVGFEAVDVVDAPVTLSNVEYATPESHILWYDGFLEDLAALPGVEGVGLMSSAPMTGFLPNGRMELDHDPERQADAGYVVASGGAFAALDIPVVQGRTFDEGDTRASEHVAMVSRSFAERYWPDQDAVGHYVNGGGMDDFWQERTFARVVGVVGDVRFRGLADEAIPTVYFPYTQRPFRIRFSAEVFVEAAGAAAPMVPAVREALRRAEPDVPPRLKTLDEVVRGSVADRRFVLMVLGGFSVTALLLAGVGIYGVVSWTVARRTREMGIRMALGARRAAVVRMVFLGALRIVVMGVVVGGGAGLALSGAVDSMLYGVEPDDPLTFVAVTALLLGAAAVATWIPAARGTRIDPMVTMRAE